MIQENKKESRLSLRVTNKLRRVVEKSAKENGITISQELERIIRQYYS